MTFDLFLLKILIVGFLFFDLFLVISGGNEIIFTYFTNKGTRKFFKSNLEAWFYTNGTFYKITSLHKNSDGTLRISTIEIKFKKSWFSESYKSQQTILEDKKITDLNLIFRLNKALECYNKRVENDRILNVSNIWHDSIKNIKNLGDCQ